MKTKINTITDKRYVQLITRLKTVRSEAGVKQEYICNKLGKYNSWLSKIENFDRRLDVLEFLELCELYNKPFEYYID